MQTRKAIKLYICSDEAGALHIRELKSGPLEQKDLDSSDAFIIDNGQLGIWVWIGKKASKEERVEAMRNAQGFIKKKGNEFCFEYLSSIRKLFIANKLQNKLSLPVRLKLLFTGGLHHYNP